jgi:hypothetical protein
MQGGTLMHHDASPPETLHLLILKALARPLRSGQFFVDRARRLCYTAAMVSVCRSKFACLACVLWLLWAAPPLTGQQAVLSGQDAQFFEAYRRADPITKWPLKKTLKEIPQLNGLKPAQDQSQLPGILRGVSENLHKFVTNFVNIAARETIEEHKGGAAGNTSMRPNNTFQEYRYLMLARREGSAFTLVEYRTDLHGREERSREQARDFMKTTGFAAMPLIFGPLQQPWSDFRLLGQQKIGGDRTEVVAFAEHIEPRAVMCRFSTGEASIPILFQGVAWIRSSDYQILKMRTDLLGPLPSAALDQLTTVVLFARNQLRDTPTAFWLPRHVRVSVALGPYLFFNRHWYSDYQQFRVKSVIKTDFPAAQQH